MIFWEKCENIQTRWTDSQPVDTMCSMMISCPTRVHTSIAWNGFTSERKEPYGSVSIWEQNTDIGKLTTLTVIEFVCPSVGPLGIWESSKESRIYISRMKVYHVQHVGRFLIRRRERKHANPVGGCFLLLCSMGQKHTLNVWSISVGGSTCGPSSIYLYVM